MTNKLYIPFLSLGLLIATATFAQDDKTKKDDGKKKTEQDTTKKSGGGTRMAINSQGLPTKGGTKSSTSNKTASDPKKDETNTKKEDPKK